jgi:hypothetical protein
VRVQDKHGKPARWVVTVQTVERGLCWLIALGEDERDANRYALHRLRADHGVDVLNIASAAEVGI